MDLAGNGHATTVLTHLALVGRGSSRNMCTDLDQSAGFVGADTLR